MKRTEWSIRLIPYQLTETVVILLATMLLPLLVHLLPDLNDQPMGKILLPVFWAPMVAVYFFRRHVAIIAGIFAPLFNFLLLGRPDPDMVLLLSFEVVVFVLLLDALRRVKFMQYLAVAVSYIVAAAFALLLMFVLGSLSNPIGMWISSMQVAVPGIGLMVLANLLILRLQRK